MMNLFDLQAAFEAEMRRAGPKLDPFVPKDFIPVAVKAMTKLMAGNLNNTLYLFAKAISSNAPCFLDLNSTAFKLINLILLAAAEPDVEAVRNGSAKFMHGLNFILQDGELGLLNMNSVVFPTKRFRYELQSSKSTPNQNTITLKEIWKIMKKKVVKKSPQLKAKPKSLFSDMKTKRSKKYGRGKTYYDLDTGAEGASKSDEEGRRDGDESHTDGDVTVKTEVEDNEDSDNDGFEPLAELKKIDQVEHAFSNISPNKQAHVDRIVKDVFMAGNSADLAKQAKQNRVIRPARPGRPGRQRLEVKFESAIECEKCKGVFWSETKKTNHTKQGYCFKCGDCEGTFDDRTAYVDHQKDAHGKTIFVCLFCHKHNDQPIRHKNHEKYCRTFLKKYKCSMCRKNFPDHQTRMVHQRQCKPEICRVCSGVFARKFDLRSHMSRVHQIHKCTRCGEEGFANSNELVKHMKREHYLMRKQNQPDVICDICGKTVKRLGFKKHMKNHADPSTWQKLPCDICGKTFKSKQTLKLHRRLHGDSANAPCTICGKRIRRANLMDHMAVHANTPRFPCPICDESFIQRVQYQRHVIRHLGLTFTCDICKHTYQSPDNLREHIRRFHKGFKLVMENFWYPSTSQRSGEKFDLDQFAKKNANFKMHCVRIDGSEATSPESTRPAQSLTRKPRKPSKPRAQQPELPPPHDYPGEHMGSASADGHPVGLLQQNDPMQRVEPQDALEWQMSQQQNHHIMQHQFAAPRPPRFMPQNIPASHQQVMAAHQHNPFHYSSAAMGSGSPHFLHHAISHSMAVGSHETLSYQDAEVLQLVNRD